MNDALAGTEAAAATSVWPAYVARWLAWNHLRTLMTFAAALAQTLAAARAGGAP